MTDSTSIQLTSSELGNLWMTYQEKTMFLRFLEHFLEHAETEDAKHLLQNSCDASAEYIKQMTAMFQKAGAVLPVGFTEHDVRKGAPKLFDYAYDLMFLRLMSEIEAALFSLFSTMSYRQDVSQLFRQLTAEAQLTNEHSTQHLLQIGVLARPPYVTMPKDVEFISNQSYFKGNRLLTDKRPLNTIEVSLIHHAIETNLVGLQLMMGFAQTATDEHAKSYFRKGMKLAMKIETTLGEFFREEYIEPPATHAGKVTTSTVPPFSDKIMMYLTSLLSTFGLGSNAIGGAFSLRNDLPLTMALLSKDIISFAKEGGMLMIEHRWMEEPPQMEDRRQLTR